MNLFINSSVKSQFHLFAVQCFIFISLDSRKTSVLRKQGNSSDSGIGEDSAENWVNAPEFVPSGKNNIPKTAENGK
jgi:hypothetical protein